MKEKRKIRVILADRDGFYLQRLKRCLERRGEMTVLGMTDSGPELLQRRKICIFALWRRNTAFRTSYIVYSSAIMFSMKIP